MLVVLLLNIFLINPVYPKAITFTLNNYRYHLRYDSSLLSFKDPSTELTIESKKCNLHVFKYSINLIENYLSHSFIALDPAKNIKLEVDNKVYYESPATTRGAYFLNFRSFMISKKIEEDLNCK